MGVRLDALVRQIVLTCFVVLKQQRLKGASLVILS
jgi:hypothetical protein